MSSPLVAELATALKGIDSIDKTPLPLRLYTSTEAKALNNEPWNNGFMCVLKWKSFFI